jgi:hypothetical protein
MRGLPLLVLAAGAFGCKALEAPAPPPQVINVRVYSDPGKALANAEIMFNGRKIATTANDGLAQLKLGGRDGDAFDIRVVCPAGFRSPDKPIQVVLKRFADPKKSPEYTVSCPPSTRTIVVAVRADNGPNLPVTYLGREVTRTDDSGAAHVLLKLQPGDQFELTLSTVEKASENLRPQNPALSFVVGQRDEVLTFDQKFELEQKKQPRFTGGGAPKPTGPVKVDR